MTNTFIPTSSQMLILRHALGLRNDDPGVIHKNHFFCRVGATEHDDCRALVAAGLMKQHPRVGRTETDQFSVTEEGWQVALRKEVA